jgi:hypothetical protein
MGKNQGQQKPKGGKASKVKRVGSALGSVVKATNHSSRSGAVRVVKALHRPGKGGKPGGAPQPAKRLDAEYAALAARTAAAAAGKHARAATVAQPLMFRAPTFVLMAPAPPAELARAPSIIDQMIEEISDKPQPPPAIQPSSHAPPPPPSNPFAALTERDDPAPFAFAPATFTLPARLTTPGTALAVAATVSPHAAFHAQFGVRRAPAACPAAALTRPAPREPQRPVGYDSDDEL